jgi:putative DNA primase/helicase
MAQIEDHKILDTESLITEYATTLRKEFRFATMTDTDELYLYNEAAGIYDNNGEVIIKIQLESIAPDITNHKVNEVIQKIKRNTYLERKEFDCDPAWLHVDNGWLNLTTGETESHNPERFSLSKMPVKYDVKAGCPVVVGFLKSTLDPESVKKVVRMIGYCLIPSCKFEKAFMLVGSGNNGKSTLIKLIEALFGKQNVSNVSLQELHERFAKADLYGKWVNTFADIPNKKITETGIFKMLVSGDSIGAERKNRDRFNFNNRAKLIFSANEIPQSDDESNAYFRRWVIVPFRRSFEGDEGDPDLVRKLTAPEELSGLLNIVIAAMKDLEREGVFEAESIDEIRAIYETGASRVRDFISEKCVLEADRWIESSRLQETYRQYGKEKGDGVLDDNQLGKELKRLGVRHKQKRLGAKSRWTYIGITLKAETLTA